MKDNKVLFIGLLIVLAITGCGGGSKAPADMTKYEGDAVSIEYPKAWKDSSMNMFGMTIGIFSPMELGEESLTAMDDPFAMVENDPLVMFLVVPAAMAGDLNLDELDEEFVSADDKDVTLVKQGDIDLDGIKGTEVVAKGTPKDVGRKIGIHIVGAEKADGSAVAFIGISPEKDLDKNLEIFEYMVKSIKFK